MKPLQVDTKGETVADLSPPVPDDTPANLDITVTAKSVSRPSLEVETEVHAHLAPRIEAHLRRIEGWDMRDLPQDHMITVETLAAIRENFRRLGEILHELNKLGFVAKSTASTRKRAALKCAVGQEVRIRDDVRAKMVGLFYSEEELSCVRLVRVGEDSVLLAAGGREIGPLPFAYVELVNG